MRSRGLRAYRNRNSRFWRRVSVCLFAVAVVTAICLVRCREVVYAFAKSSAAWTAEKTTNETVARVIQDNQSLCRELISVAYNDTNVVSDLRVDSTGVNTIKTAVSAAVMDALKDATGVDVQLPLATLFGLDWLSGWGPRITVPMSATQSVFTSVSSSIEDVGINQSIFQVNVRVRVNLWIVTPAGYADVTVDNDFPVAQTVLLGKVPDNLTEVYGDSQDTIGEIFDYGTIND